MDEKYIDRRLRWGPESEIAVSTGRAGISPELLSRKWGIGLKKATDTVRVTTQRGVRNLSNPLVRRLKTQKWRNKRKLSGKWFSDTMHFKDLSIMRQEKAAQVFTNGKGYDEFFPIERESRCSDGLSRFINEVGIPDQLVVDGAKAQGSIETYNTHWQKLINLGSNHIVGGRILQRSVLARFVKK